ncbi:MAG: hypothetical protein MK102_15440 [Fuerstiella sp.]|nr:hypothetical protein [Fuerstiella sp.]
MSSNSRSLKYSRAINEAFVQLMTADPSVFIIGQGVKSPWYVGQTCAGLIDQFGETRVIDTPVSENAMTGAAVGAAIAGMKAVSVHPRMDFALYGLDPVINEAANWHYMFGGAASVPVVVWGIINRKGEQGAQHSQALHAMFAQIPGLKVVAPATPYDAKGLMVAAINDPNPVIFVDDRWLYDFEDDVPEELYESEIGKAQVLKQGTDLTIVTSSYLTQESLKAAAILADSGVDVEVLDLRTIKPLDVPAILASVRSTGRLLAIDGGWRSFGVAAEIVAVVSEEAFEVLKSPVRRLTLPDLPAPASRSLEDPYYITSESIVEVVKSMLNVN